MYVQTEKRQRRSQRIWSCRQADKRTDAQKNRRYKKHRYANRQKLRQTCNMK